MVKIDPPNEEMVLEAFMKGLQTNPFSESLLRDRPETMAEVRRKAITHIDAEETMKWKRVEERRPLQISNLV